MKSLNKMDPEKLVFILDVQGSTEDVLYLDSLGIFPEALITVIENNPKNSGPVLIEVNNSRFAIDEKFAKNIIAIEALEDLTLIFRGNKTYPREVILKKLQQQTGHFSLDEMTSIVQTEDSKIGNITVYRVLRTLLEKGILEEIEFPDGMRKFEVKKGHHDHIICEKCGNIIEFHCDEIEKKQNIIAKRHHVKIKSHSLVLIATVCENCCVKGDCDICEV